VTDYARAHVDALRAALSYLDARLERIERWGSTLGAVLAGGGRLLAAGNGGSAALAEHLTSELLGRYRDERRPLSAIALTADTPACTAIANDYGYETVFDRQVRAHGRRGDVLMLFTTSGRSPNLQTAADAGRACGLAVWGVTGPRPNPLERRCDDVLGVETCATATIQEVHQVVVHLLCAAVDRAIGTES
jgi:phosphoheptose isomerase